jgi:hypothetical protein
MLAILTTGRQLILNQVMRNQLQSIISLHMFSRLQPGLEVCIPIIFILVSSLTSPPGCAPSSAPTAVADNPWADQCPVPYHFWVNSFYSNTTFISLTVSYNGRTFLCPNAPFNEITYNSVYDIYCGDDGLVRVITDGQSWITISGYSWCLPIPRYVCSASNMHA